MDTASLINEVHSKRPLWDLSHRHHRNRHILDQLWDEVGAAIGVSRNVARTRWKNLRDHFRREVKKLPLESSWPHFKAMSFLINMTLENYHSKLSIKTDTSDINRDNYSDEIDESQLDVFNPDTQLDTESNPEEPKFKIKVKKFKREIKEPDFSNIVAIEPANDRDVNIIKSEEDYHFLMSLLPHLASLEPIKKMRLRMKINELIYNEVYNPK